MKPRTHALSLVLAALASACSAPQQHGNTASSSPAPVASITVVAPANPPPAGPAPVAVTPDAPFRAHAPDALPTRPFAPPQVQSFTL
ncbi:MAG: hypothetical protein WCJ30_09415, partial [Deltaproteobacteria bacterium]